MIDEEVIFGLVQTAKDQQTAVEKATQAMNTQRVELYDAIALLKKMQASVAAEAKQGAKEGLTGITTSANTALTAEVNKAKETIGAVAAQLRVSAFGKSLKWISGSVSVGFVLGFALCWYLQADARNTSKKLDVIAQALMQFDADVERATQKKPQQQQHPAAHTPKPQGAQQVEPQEQP